MNAIKAIRRHIETNPGSESARTLSQLVVALAEEQTYALADLYRLDQRSFELALDFLRDWRLDRYYAARIKLFDTILGELKLEAAQPLPGAG